MSAFHFKQFTIQQQKSAMKVGTDSILLGSWVQLNKVDSVLDIGAGTGILALLIAQRSDAKTIDAVEIDDATYEEAVTNFENSPWGDRLFCYHSSIQGFTKQIDDESPPTDLGRYDLIIANPPYFDASLKSKKTKRNIARQSLELNHSTLLKNTRSLLNKTGSCAFIIPYKNEDLFIKTANEHNLFVNRITRTKDTQNADNKRSLLQFSFQKSQVEISEFILKNEDHSYSDAFSQLTRDFYTIF